MSDTNPFLGANTLQLRREYKRLFRRYTHLMENNHEILTKELIEALRLMSEEIQRRINNGKS